VCEGSSCNKNCSHRSASALSPIKRDVFARPLRHFKKPRFGMCDQRTYPEPFQPLPRNASNPRWYPTRYAMYESIVSRPSAPNQAQPSRYVGFDATSFTTAARRSRSHSPNAASSDDVNCTATAGRHMSAGPTPVKLTFALICSA